MPYENSNIKPLHFIIRVIYGLHIKITWFEKCWCRVVLWWVAKTRVALAVSSINVLIGATKEIFVTRIGEIWTLRSLVFCSLNCIVVIFWVMNQHNIILYSNPFKNWKIFKWYIFLIFSICLMLSSSGYLDGFEYSK